MSGDLWILSPPDFVLLLLLYCYMAKKHRKRVINGMEEAGSFRVQPRAWGRGDSRCKICGLPVDRGRVDAHMVRFHGGEKWLAE